MEYNRIQKKNHLLEWVMQIEQTKMIKEEKIIIGEKFEKEG